MADDQHLLDFERPLYELEEKLSEMRTLNRENPEDLSAEINALEERVEQLRESIYRNLTRWQRVQIARHPQRPYTLDHIEALTEGFVELHGDRKYGDDRAIVGGLATFKGSRFGSEDRTVMIMGHQKGRDTKERVRRNYGMPKPEGYRKAQRLMLLAEKFSLPVITLIDTPGAYPGVGAEERGQSEAIARSLFMMAELETPIISVVIGEGGSGGALAIGVGDRLLMLQYAVYSVISPEGCASILWKSAEKAREAAEAMRITAKSLQQYKLIDEIIPEPLGGAHRDPRAAAETLKNALIRHLDELEAGDIGQVLEKRRQRLASFGEFRDG